MSSSKTHLRNEVHKKKHINKRTLLFI